MENPQRTPEQSAKPLEKEQESSARARSDRPPSARPLVLWLAAASLAVAAGAGLYFRLTTQHADVLKPAHATPTATPANDVIRPK
ncbi:MAG TPA: hypothetical protein VN894_00225 [Polyangiaceae bacterium]|nr:hypothetical protein [Polyangiaceae bacterium]